MSNKQRNNKRVGQGPSRQEFLQSVPDDRPCLRTSLACQSTCPCGCNVPAGPASSSSAPAQNNRRGAEQLEAEAAAAPSEAATAPPSEATVATEVAATQSVAAHGSRAAAPAAGGSGAGGHDRPAQAAAEAPVPPFLQAWAPKYAVEQKKCQCSGHCGQPGHRYRQGCDVHSRIMLSRSRRQTKANFGNGGSGSGSSSSSSSSQQQWQWQSQRQCQQWWQYVTASFGQGWLLCRAWPMRWGVRAGCSVEPGQRARTPTHAQAHRMRGHGVGGLLPQRQLQSLAPPYDFTVRARYCLKCLCSRPDCDAPRFRGPWCKGCAAKIQHLPGVWKMVHASRAFLHKMIPCDMVCFATHFAEMHRDFAMSVLAAKTREPVFIKSLLDSWRASPGNYTGADLTHWIRRGIAASAEGVGNALVAAQKAQLATEGAGHHRLGPRALGCELGIICRKSGGSLCLSQNKSRYEFAESSEDLDEFVRVCRKFQGALSERSNLSAMLEEAGKALSEAGEACTALVIASPGSAVRKAILRKFMLGYLAGGGILNWGQLNVDELLEIIPVEGDHLKGLPEGDNMSALSMLILGRPDHGMFLSMWSCLFAGACADGSEDCMARALEEHGGAAVDAWLDSHAGTGPRPSDLCGQLGKRRLS